MHIDELVARLPEFIRVLEGVKAKIAPTDFAFYPYGTLHNVGHLDKLLSGMHRDLGHLIGSRRVLDIGAADGELAFFLEAQGADVDVVDFAPTNYNGLRGIRALRDALESRIGIYEVDLDAQFALPDHDYSLAIFLGILYHLKNPFFALEALAQRSDWCLLSTRVARQSPDGHSTMRDYPVAYLVGEDELNHDATNFWIFSETGLRRLLHRSGWETVEFITVGNTTDSDPAHGDKDERAFCLARSTAKT